MTEESGSVPIKPARLRVELEEIGSSLSLRYDRRQWSPGCFLMLWLCGWTVGCVFLAGQIWNNPQMFMIAFAVPFWSSWFVVFFLVLAMFLQREELTLDQNGVMYTKWVLLPIRRRTIPLVEVVRFEHSKSTETNSERSPTYCLELLTMGQPLTLLPNLSTDERLWLTWRLNESLKSLKPEAATDDAEVSRPAQIGDSEPPTDCSWHHEDSFDGPVFTQRGRLSVNALPGLLFINLFWNGIVSVFVMVLVGGAPGGPARFSIEWWGMAVFLIPFEVIGLLMFAALLVSLLEPVRRTTWSFEQDQITFRHTWFGIGYRRRYDATSISGARVDGQDQAASSSLPMPPTFTSGSTRLRLIDHENSEVVGISGLTKGEARWMMDILKRDRRDWFR